MVPKRQCIATGTGKRYRRKLISCFAQELPRYVDSYLPSTFHRKNFKAIAPSAANFQKRTMNIWRYKNITGETSSNNVTVTEKIAFRGFPTIRPPTCYLIQTVPQTPH